MTSLRNFRKWLWGDWGKPNPLTRAGVPRILTNVFAYLLGAYIWYVVTLRLIPQGQKRNFTLFVHDPLILLAFVVFYISLVSYTYLQSFYNPNPVSKGDYFMMNWKDPFVKVCWVTLFIAGLLLLSGTYHFHRE